jgi:hypothetical protein
MSAHRITQLNTRTGGHSAKNAHRAGAPNTQEMSGEVPMVGTQAPPSEAAVEAVRQRIAGQTHRFLIVDGTGRLRVSIAELAVLIAEIVEQSAASMYGGAA